MLKYKMKLNYVTLKTDKNYFDYSFFEILIFYFSKLSTGLFFSFLCFLSEWRKKFIGW